MRKKQISIPRTGSVILNGLQKVITEIRHLETICPDHASELEHCEEQLKGIAVEVASVCTEGESTDQFESMIKDAGIEISQDIFDSLREMESDDSTLDD